MFAPSLAMAQTRGTVDGSEPQGFARMIFRFDTPIRANARIGGTGVLVLTFSEPAKVVNERLATQLRNYVSVVRHDPDGRAMRFALKQSLRVNVIEAGEQIFVDLLPSNWTGLLPGLPQDVVADLAERARVAEARLRETERRTQDVAAEMPFRIGRLPTLTRVSFEPPRGTQVTMVQRDQRAIVSFAGAVRLDVTDLRRQLSDVASNVTTEVGTGHLDLYLQVPPGITLRSFQEDEAFVLDIDRPDAPGGAPAAAGANVLPAPAAAPPAAPVANPTPAPPAAVAAVPEPEKPSLQAPRAPAQALPTPLDPANPRLLEGPVVPAAELRADGLQITFPFLRKVAAAAFLRGRELTLAFDTNDIVQPLRLDRLGPEARALIKSVDVSRQERLAVVRFSLGADRLARLLPEGEGWVLTIAETTAGPSAPLDVSRATDDQGRVVISVAMGNVSGIHWIEDAVVGDRIALATAMPPARGVPRAFRMVEFSVLTSIHGVAVAALADDIVVAKTDTHVTVTRVGGLALSQVGVAAAPAGFKPVIERASWLTHRAGSVRDRWRVLADAAVSASPANRPEARAELAAFLVANSLAVEAKGVLDAMAQDNAALNTEKPFVLRRALVDIMLHRDSLAAARLAASSFGDDPEIGLWRAVVDERSGRYMAALDGFRRASDLMDAYPEDLQASLLGQAVRAAIEARDFPAAEAWMAKLAALPSDLAPRSGLDFLRALADEAMGRPARALEAYQRLAEGADRPMAVQATLRATELGLRTGSVSPADALVALETLSIVWRGDDTELRALSHMGQIYGATGQWRRAFQTARQANDLFPDHPLTRRLHDETAAQFESLFLDGKGDTLDRVEALAIYYDFKEFTPVGRRGDELIRHLADRLIDLDLLEQAGDLLEYQVANRLSGAGKVAVATKLASLRLVSGQPAAALQILSQSRLPDVSADVKRARLVLEAKALADLSRTDLAIELLDGENGPDMDRMRADIYWSGSRWRDAGEMIERNLGAAWQEGAPLTDRQREDVKRAAIAYVLADETLGLDRLRAKFAAKMGDTPDAPIFNFLTTPGSSRTDQFRAMAGTVNSETLSQFFETYRRLYPAVSTPARPSPNGTVPPPSAATTPESTPAG